MRPHLFTAARVLLGFLFTASAIAGMLGKVPPPEPEAAQQFMGILLTSGLLTLVKVLELLGGLALLSGRFVSLALLVLAPILVNIGFFHLSLDPSGIPVGVVLGGLWVATAWSQRAVLAPLLQVQQVAA
jgi:uncharacterized membrane protein YphA (DoxX/SURF4 family)